MEMVVRGGRRQSITNRCYKFRRRAFFLRATRKGVGILGTGLAIQRPGVRVSVHRGGFPFACPFLGGGEEAG